MRAGNLPDGQKGSYIKLNAAKSAMSASSTVTDTTSVLANPALVKTANKFRSAIGASCSIEPLLNCPAASSAICPLT